MEIMVWLLPILALLVWSATAVTAEQLIVVQDPAGRRNYPVLAAKTLYSGTLVFIAASGGYATDVIATGANYFGGIAAETIDNSAGSSGDKRIECWTQGTFELVGTGFTQDSVGEKVYAADNYTLSLTATSQTFVGVIEEYISSTRVAVRIRTGNLTP